ncbi:activating signal cointegrator 1 complex subunit [Nesidiocoris tenuis]|uniref:Activating signal cointegrator 1 complex subunit n=1 Tax=Nesidiocoris tenuis TaxID=355587 RepID=A0ABN7ADB7_9HEMI|nr:activating signal cointegrator 1 complex subunit [Nesidiocoris tenuis]
MDVMKPDLEWIDGICYRINPGQGNHGFDKNSFDPYSYEIDESCPVEAAEDVDLEVENIQEIEGGRFRLSFHVAKVYFSYIIGSKGATKKRLETETRTRITIPKPGVDGDIVITGPDKKAVNSARTRIQMMVLSSRKRQATTHFISLPFVAESFINGFLTFREEVLTSCRDEGVDESIFQTPEKLHLTICTLVLGDDVERKQASSALQKCKEEIIRPLLPDQPIQVEMSGVEYMNDDPSAIDVLYGRVKCLSHPELLQILCDAIVDFFVEQGLVDREHEHVKLHVTLMNTLFRKTESYDGKKERQTFDGRQIVTRFSDFFFGSDVLSQIDLSLRFTTSKSGYYQASTSISIP